MLNTMLGALSSDIAIDLGTAHTRIFARGRGIVCFEPTALTIQEDRAGRRNVIAVGQEAVLMEGRTPQGLRVLRPVHAGVISDYEVAEALLSQLVMEVQGRRLWVGPRAAVCVPHGTTEVERRALRECAEASGAREVLLIDATLAAAIGVGLPVDEPHGQLIVDVGAGSTEVAVISLGGVVYSRSLKIGGRQLDEAIQRMVADKYGLAIGLAMAEEVKHTLGRAMPCRTDEACRVRGRSLKTGFPAEAQVSSVQVAEALSQPVRLMVEAVVATLEHTPPDLAADVAGTGIVLTGGGALLRDLDHAVGEATGLPVVIPEDPFASAVEGAARWMAAGASARTAAG